jgi:hypothetical protein
MVKQEGYTLIYGGANQQKEAGSLMLDNASIRVLAQ